MGFYRMLKRKNQNTMFWVSFISMKYERNKNGNISYLKITVHRPPCQVIFLNGMTLSGRGKGTISIKIKKSRFNSYSKESI